MAILLLLAHACGDWNGSTKVLPLELGNQNLLLPIQTIAIADSYASYLRCCTRGVKSEGHLVQAITGILYFYRQFGYEYALGIGRA